MKVVYLKIAEKIRNRINDNYYPINSFLLSEKKLAKEYQVCSSTVRRALKQLIDEKVITAKHGKGYLVIKKTNYKNTPLTGFYKVMENAGEKNIINMVTQFAVICANKDIADKLNISLNSQVYAIQRLRLLNDIPILLENSFLAVSLLPNLTIAHLEQSKFRYIREECHIPILDGYRTFLPYLADEEMADLLKVTIEQPLLLMKTTVFSENGQPIEYSEQFLVTERYNTQHYFKT